MRKILLFMPMLLIILFPGRLYALTSSQLFSIENGSVYYQGGASAPQGCNVGSTTLTGSSNEQKTWNFFIDKGLSAPQVAGIMGNIQQESSFDPEIIQNGGNSKTPTTQAGLGWGIAMWTPTVSGPNPILSDAATYHITTPIYTLATQLNIIWAQMNGTSPTGAPDMLKGLEAINDPTGAQQAVYFEANFEEGTIAYSGGGQASQREAYAAQFLSLYGGKTTSTSNVTSSASSSSGCSTSTVSSNCTTPSVSSNNITALRQKIVCLAKGQLALWKSQPNYNAPYPGFTYAATGFLKYTASGNTYEEWCADFASWIYNQAGHPFTGGLSGWDLPGVAGIETLAKQGTGFSWHPAGSGYIPRPGDLAIYSTPSNPDFHVNIFISSSGGSSTYIGGDQSGNNTPYGAYGSAPPTPSGSVVSEVTFSGYYSNNIIGYVSPN